MGEGKKPKSKSRHKNVQLYKKYSVEGGKVTGPKNCPRCGPGTILAQHKNRVTCGRCGFSESTNKKEE